MRVGCSGSCKNSGPAGESLSALWVLLKQELTHDGLMDAECA